MTGEYKIKIGGTEKSLLFNNFAHIELSKALFEGGHYVSNPSELIQRMSEMANDNIALFMKALVYAGIVGYDYRIAFKPSMTQQEVGELIGTVDEGEMIALWDVFLDAMGVNISTLLSRQPIAASDEDAEEKKS